LNYDKFFKTQKDILTFENFSKIEWEIGQDLSEHFNLFKKEFDFEKFEEIKKEENKTSQTIIYRSSPFFQDPRSKKLGS